MFKISELPKNTNLVKNPSLCGIVFAYHAEIKDLFLCDNGFGEFIVVNVLQSAFSSEYQF